MGFAALHNEADFIKGSIALQMPVRALQHTRHPINSEAMWSASCKVAVAIYLSTQRVAGTL